MRELSPRAEAKDMKLAPTIWRVRNCPVWHVCWTHKKRGAVASSADGLKRGRERADEDIGPYQPESEGSRAS